MKITIYELIGLVKDDKAPKKIRYNNEIWKYDDECKTYDNDDYDKDLLEKLFYESYILDFINNEVEIIEYPKKIKKLNTNIINANRYDFDKNKEMTISNIAADFLSISEVVNELIDEIIKEND